MANKLAIKPPVLFLAGPTASGKTSLAMHLSNQVPCRLINVDAAQVYRGMDIGTAKITKQEQMEYPHALIDIKNPWETYSAANFCSDVKPIIELAWQNNELPVLVGGSMFYFHALENGLSRLPKGDDAIRKKITEYQETNGQVALHQWLNEVDPAMANKLAINDAQRIQRALEIFCLTGKSATENFEEDEKSRFALKDKANIIKIALSKGSRLELHQIIAQRYHQMIEDGLVDEVKNLYQNDRIDANTTAMKIVGYRQTWQYLEGLDDLNTSIEKGIAASRQLAKRQLTWLRNQSRMTWFNVDNITSAQSALMQYLQSSLPSYIK